MSEPVEKLVTLRIGEHEIQGYVEYPGDGIDYWQDSLPPDAAVELQVTLLIPGMMQDDLYEWLKKAFS